MNFIDILMSPDIPFLRYAFIIAIIVSISLGISGSIVVVKNMSYVAGAISHAILGGIGIALYLEIALKIKYINPTIGALVFAILSAYIINFAITRGKERKDTIIGIIWSVGMSVGVLFISITPGYIDPMNYLFGNILLINKSDILLILILNAFILLFLYFFYYQILLVMFDEEFAKTRGIDTEKIQLLMMIFIAVTVLMLVRIIGILMVVALLTIPPAIAQSDNNSLKKLIIKSIFINMIVLVLGIVLSFYLNVSVSVITVLLLGILYIIRLK
ncbi:MAG: zinc transport system permease protein [Fusobacteriaceae bacterium]|nr:Zinc transporter, inner rane permease protein ZnuB [Fusobacteriales bacterium]MDN5305247.1 zinc transport system permease protein [Fusobacteriaceae bacterium]